MYDLVASEPVSIQMRSTIKKVAWLSFWTPFVLALIDTSLLATKMTWPSTSLIAVSAMFLPVVLKINETLTEMDDGKTAAELPQWINDCFDDDSQITLLLK